MEYVQEIILDVNSNSAYTTIGAKQGDNGSRVINVHITQNGQDYNLLENGVNSAYFRFRKPDGKAIMNTSSIDYENNVIKLVLTAQTLAVSGRGYGDITLLSGTQILSTISFIIVIMSAPQVAGEAISSNEFGYLNAVVEDATHTIYNAEAWAAGTRSGVPVFGQNTFNITYDSIIITTISVDEETFKQQVGERHGLKRVFKFEYTEDNNWKLITTTIEGSTETINQPEIINNLSDYGIVIGLSGGADSPNAGDSINVTLEEADDAFQNNAKYYSEQAYLSQKAIEDLTVSAETVADIEHGGTAAVEKTIQDDVVHLNFKIPKGDTGDVYFMTFDIDVDPASPSCGDLIMYKPDHISPQVDFSLNNNDGNLYIEIEH